MSEITIQGIYCTANVADFDAGLAWYAQFFGRAADYTPIPGMAQWLWAGAGGFQLWHDAERAGQSRATIVVPNLAAEEARLSATGLTLSDHASGDFGAVAQIFDPEGNHITLAEPPKGGLGG